MHIRYNNNLEDGIAWQLHHFNNSPAYQKQIRTYKWSILLLVCLFCLGLYVYLDKLFYLTFGIVFIIFYLIMFDNSIKKSLEKNAKRSLLEGKNKGFLCEHKLEITPEFLIESTSSGEQKTKWDAVERIASIKGYTFVYIGSVMAHIIPEKAIIEGYYSKFVDELKNNAKHI